MDDVNPYLKHLEWETFDEKQRLTRIEKSQYINEEIKLIDIWRDEQYKLQGIIQGEMGENEKVLPGTILSAFSIYGFVNDIFRTEISHCFLGNSYTKTNPETFQQEHSTEIKPYEVKIQYLYKEIKVAKITEWYINGPEANFILPDRIDVEKDINHSYCNIRNGKKETIETYPGGKQGAGINCAFIELDKFCFNIKKVPKVFGPSWSHNYAIEYCDKWGYIPDETIRKKIHSFISFLFGRQLLYVGHSKYNEDNQIIEEIANDPWGSDIRRKCKESSLYPIKIDNHKDMGRFKELIKSSLPVFLDLYDELNIEQVLWFYWSTFNLPLGLDLPIVTAAIETLAKSWVKSTRTKLKGVYLDKTVYRNLIKDELATLDKKMDEISCPDKSIILSKIKGANEWTVSDRLKKFFDDIGLVIGETENFVLKMRNTPAHGGLIGQSQEDVETLINLKRAAITFFNRIMLKIIDYTDDYIDYVEIGYPEKNIDMPIVVIQSPKKNR